MDTAHASAKTRFKVGLFTLFAFVIVIAMTILVNNRPFWWKPCQFVKISVEDATGLKAKSPIRSLGIDIGYLKTVELSETHVNLGICLTAPVEILPTTRAYLKGEGFLGDKFVELRPVKYLSSISPEPSGIPVSPKVEGSVHFLEKAYNWIIASAYAEDEDTRKTGAVRSGRQIPVGADSQDVQHLVNRVDELVQQIGGLTDNLKRAIDPEDLKRTMKQLNHTLDNASKTLAPEGGLNQTAQRTLAKLEDSIEQLRDLMTRVNKGEGSVGMLLNDPTYAQEIHKAIQGVNLLLNKVANVRFVPDLGAAYLTGLAGSRAWFNLGIWPKKDRYYLLGVGSDSRGRVSSTQVSTSITGGSPVIVTSQVTDYTAIVFTAMMGKVFYNRLDAAVGILYGDGALSVKYNFGIEEWTERFQVGADFYFRFNGHPDARVYASVQPIKNVYLRGGLEGFRPSTLSNSLVFFLGGGLTFDDEDIKLLFALK